MLPRPEAPISPFFTPAVMTPALAPSRFLRRRQRLTCVSPLPAGRDSSPLQGKEGCHGLDAWPMRVTAGTDSRARGLLSAVRCRDEKGRLGLKDPSGLKGLKAARVLQAPPQAVRPCGAVRRPAPRPGVSLPVA
jgi:hypothetical protein